MLGLENAEEVLQILERYSKLKPKDIPQELDDYLSYVAKTGDPVYRWSAIQHLLREKLVHVIKDFHDTTPSIEDLPQCPNVDVFNYENLKTALIERLDLFNAAPFTIQRLCELLTNPKKHYCRLDKFMRALEKNILVVSTIEPGRKQVENENGDSLNLEVSLDGEMDKDDGGIVSDIVLGAIKNPIIESPNIKADNFESNDIGEICTNMTIDKEVIGDILDGEEKLLDEESRPVMLKSDNLPITSTEIVKDHTEMPTTVEPHVDKPTLEETHLDQPQIDEFDIDEPLIDVSDEIINNGADRINSDSTDNHRSEALEVTETSADIANVLFNTNKDSEELTSSMTEITANASNHTISEDIENKLENVIQLPETLIIAAEVENMNASEMEINKIFGTDEKSMSIVEEDKIDVNTISEEEIILPTHQETEVGPKSPKIPRLELDTEATSTETPQIMDNHQYNEKADIIASVPDEIKTEIILETEQYTPPIVDQLETVNDTLNNFCNTTLEITELEEAISPPAIEGTSIITDAKIEPVHSYDNSATDVDHKPDGIVEDPVTDLPEIENDFSDNIIIPNSDDIDDIIVPVVAEISSTSQPNFESTNEKIADNPEKMSVEDIEAAPQADTAMDATAIIPTNTDEQMDVDESNFVDSMDL